MRHGFLVFALAFLFQVPTLLNGAYSSLSPEQRKQFNEILDAAFTYYVSEEYDRASQYFQKALQMDPKDKTALKGMAECGEKLDKIRKEKLKLENQILALAKKAMKEQEWVEAIDHIFEVLSRSKNSEALGMRSRIEVSIKKQMSEVPVDSADYLVCQGILLYMNRRYQEAIRTWKDALTIVKNQVKLMIYLQKADTLLKETQQYEIVTVGRKKARAAFEAENYQESAALWKKIIEINPKDEEAQREIKRSQELAERKNKESLLGEYYDKGLSLFLEGKYQESLAFWERILAISPNNEVAKDYVKKIQAKGILINSARSSQISAPEKKPAKSSGAVKTSTKSAENLSEELPVVLYDKAVQLYQLGQYQEALDYFETVLKKTPEDQQVREWIENVKKERAGKAEEYYQKGLLAYSGGKMEEAVRSWQKALEIFPQHSASHRALTKAKGENK